MINYKDFQVVFKVMEVINYYNSIPHLTFKLTSEYRKHEYVFGVHMKFEEYNFKIGDYASVCFNDADKNDATEDDFKELLEDIEAFIAKLNSLSHNIKIYGTEKLKTTKLQEKEDAK